MKYILLIASLVIIQTGSTHAASSGWVNAHQVEGVFRQINRNNMIPTNINCRWGNQVGQTRENTLLKVEYEPNRYRQQWRWAWGNKVPSTDAKYRRQGYFIVSSAAFQRTSGLTVQCAIWHK